MEIKLQQKSLRRHQDLPSSRNPSVANSVASEVAEQDVETPPSAPPPTVKLDRTTASLAVKQTLTLTATVTGEPRPTVAWKRNGVKITSSRHLTIEEKPRTNQSVLTLTNLTVEDAAKYSVTVQNEQGEADCRVLTDHFDHPFGAHQLRGTGGLGGRSRFGLG